MKTSKLAAYLLALLILSPLVEYQAHAQQSSMVQRAQEVHEEGIRLFREGWYREAAAAFARAEQLAPNPLNQYNQARCYQELGELETALRLIDQYLANSELTVEDRASAGQLRNQILAASRAAARPPSETQPAEPEPERFGREHRRQAGPWALLATGLGLLVLGGILDIVAFTQSDPDATARFESLNEYVMWRTRVRNIAIGGDVLVSVGAAAAVGGLIWLIVTRRRRSTFGTSRHPVSSTSTAEGMRLTMGFGL